MTGYLHPGYAQSFSEFGSPRKLPECGGWIIERAIPGTEHRDAMGCYPIFACRDWSKLPADIESLKPDLVSVALVTDPFGDFDICQLQQYFDVMIPFKEHLVADLARPLEEITPKGHRYDTRYALRRVSVEFCTDPAQYIEDWMGVFGNLIERHNIRGVSAFSREVFLRQFEVPGFYMFRASRDGETVGMQSYFVHGDVAYGHLMAMNEVGYRVKAAYGLTWTSFEYLASQSKWIDTGAGAGLDDNRSDGLLAFKRGWTTDTRTVYFCGKILDPERYNAIVSEKGVPPTKYFPAYRDGEFG